MVLSLPPVTWTDVETISKFGLLSLMDWHVPEGDLRLHGLASAVVGLRLDSRLYTRENI
jgi:hypothetical protein